MKTQLSKLDLLILDELGYVPARKPTNYRNTRFRDATRCYVEMSRFQNITPLKQSRLTDASWEPRVPAPGRLAAHSPGKTGPHPLGTLR